MTRALVGMTPPHARANARDDERGVGGDGEGIGEGAGREERRVVGRNLFYGVSRSRCEHFGLLSDAGRCARDRAVFAVECHFCILRHWFELRTSVRGAHVSVHHLWVDAETVDKSLSTDLPYDSLVVVVPQGAAQLVVAHVGLVLVMAPPDSDGVGLQQPKLPFFCRVCPFDEITVLSVLVVQHGVEKLPQLHASFS